MDSRIVTFILFLAVSAVDGLAADAGKLPLRSTEVLDERLARSTSSTDVKVVPVERLPPKFATPVVSRNAGAAPVARPEELLAADLTQILTDAFRFNRGARMTAGFSGQKVVVSRELTDADELNAVLFAKLLEVLENEDAQLHRFIADSSQGFSLEAFARDVAFAPTLNIVLLGSRPLEVEFDFHGRRAIVSFDGRWSSRAIPRGALASLLPAIGSEIYSFLDAEAEAGRP